MEFDGSGFEASDCKCYFRFLWFDALSSIFVKIENLVHSCVSAYIISDKEERIQDPPSKPSSPLNFLIRSPFK